MPDACPDLHEDFIESHNFFEIDNTKLPTVTSNKIKDKVIKACSKVSKIFILFFFKIKCLRVFAVCCCC